MTEEHETNLLQQEVNELTELLRRAARWEDLRIALASKNLGPNDVLLVTFYEDEEDGEYGILVSLDRKVIEYERCTRNELAHRFRVWRDRTGDSRFSQEYPQIGVALASLSKD